MNGIRSTFPPLYKALLLNSAEDRGTAGGDTAYGWGYIDLQAAYQQRANVREGNVTAGPVHYVFYRGSAAAGDKATLVWNRHSTYNGASYPLVYSATANDLDLLSYNEAGGSLISSSTRTVDNVEQVSAPGAVASMVYKVNVPGSLSGVTREHYAIVLPSGAVGAAAPSLTAAVSGPPAMEMGAPFTITANVTDVGGLAAQAVSVTLTLPPGLVLVSGANPQTVGRITAGGMRAATWQVSGVTLGPKTVTATATSVSYEETFSATSAPYSVVIVDSVPPTSSVDTLPATTTSSSFSVTATAYDLGGVASVELFYRHNGGSYLSYGTDNLAPWAWMFDTTSTFGDGFYEFYSVATDISTKREANASAPDTGTLVDATPPTSAMVPLPTYETVPTFDIASTPTDSGGISSVSFYVRLGGGAWTYLGDATSAPWIRSFDSAASGGDGSYEFYSIATDTIGNREPKAPGERPPLSFNSR